jgi:hypothetical protein
MLRRSAVIVLALLMMQSVGGIICGQAQAASGARCCKSSCPKSHHRGPLKCCSLSLAQTTAEVASVNHGAPEPTQMTVLNVTASSFLRLDLGPVLLEKIHPPPGPSPSPVLLCANLIRTRRVPEGSSGLVRAIAYVVSKHKVAMRPKTHCETGAASISISLTQTTGDDNGAAWKLSAFYTFTVLAVGFIVEQSVCSCRARLEAEAVRI